jgi:hypothetical protein
MKLPTSIAELPLIVFTFIAGTLYAAVVTDLRGRPVSPAGLDLTTNTIVMVSTNGYAEFIDKAVFLRAAITNGEVCNIVGHQWHPHSGFMAIHPIHIDPPEPRPVHRECALCKRVEQQVIEWRGVSP